MAEEHRAQSSTQSSDQSSSQDSLNNPTQIPKLGGLKSPNGNIPMFPIIYHPVLVPGLLPQQDQEQMNRGPGLYAVPVLPFSQPVTGFPLNTLIPFTYNLPTERTSPEIREVGGEQGQPGELQQRPQQAVVQRQVVRRFEIAIQLDVLLMLKLAAVIFLFNDGSRQRLFLLVVFASIIYLYQTGALAPVIRWLSQGMPRAVAPPQPPRAGFRAGNLPVAGAQGHENAGMADEQPVVGNENREANDGNMAVENQYPVEPVQHEAGWRGIVREIRLIVFGFFSSLFPGVHNAD